MSVPKVGAASPYQVKPQQQAQKPCPKAQTAGLTHKLPTENLFGSKKA